MSPGDKVEWDTVHGKKAGIVLRKFRHREWYVELPSGKHVIVAESSAKKI